MDDYTWYEDDYQKEVNNQSFNQEEKPQEVIIYEKKKEKKPKIWLAAVSSAVATSLLCTGIFAAFFYNNPEKSQINYSVAWNSGDESSSESSTLTGVDPAIGRVQMNFVDIAEKVGPCIVGIVNKATSAYYYNQQINLGSGSGIIIKQDGYILTNAHVIEGGTDITVILNTQKEYTATVIGKDTTTDLAVLKIDETNLPTAVIGDSTKVKVGEPALAIGNPLGQELAGTVTGGYISAVNRSIQIDRNTQLTLLQTDAAINPGNSGGALVNTYGEVIGITNAKINAEGVEGIGFAIPTSEAMPVVENLIEYGYVKGRPMIGISGSDTRFGIYVEAVSPDSGAEKAGITVGDIIIKANGTAVKTVAELNKIKDQYKPGDQMTLTIFRNQEIIDVTVTLSEAN